MVVQSVAMMVVDLAAGWDELTDIVMADTMADMMVSRKDKQTVGSTVAQ